MTALDITYEDGLRLSELYGQLAGLEYESTHLIAINLAAFILVIALGMAISILPIAILWNLDSPCRRGFETEEEARMMSTWAFRPKVVSRGDQAWSPLVVEWVHTWAYYAVTVLSFIVIPLALCIIVYVHLGASNGMAIADVQAQIDAILAKCGGMA